MGHFSLMTGYGQEKKMISIGIDTHERMHYVEAQNERQQVMWHGSISNNREGFCNLIEKIRSLCRSNSQEVIGIFMNPTGNYHIPLKYFLEARGNKVFLIDSRKTFHLRQIMNLGTEKSDREDAHILAATPWIDRNSAGKAGHSRSSLSEITRLREIVNRNITRIANYINSDLAAVFPEFCDEMSIESKTGLVILEKYTLPSEISRLSPSDLTGIARKNGNYKFSKEDAERLIKVSCESIGIPDPDGAYAFRIRINAMRLSREIYYLKEIEDKIEDIGHENTDIRNISDMRGMSVVAAARIVSEIGSIDQFDSALKLQSYAGRCPDMTGSSGKSYARGLTRVRNEYLSSAIHESSIKLVRYQNREFLNLYLREIKKGKKPTQAYVVVGKRLLFHVFSIMKNGKPYRERIAREGEGTVSGGTP